MQDTEFTVEEGQLYMLQTRNAKRPAQAAVRFARDAVDEGLLDRDQALMTIDADMLTALLVETFDPKADYEVIATGVAAPRPAAPRARSSSPPRRPSRPPPRAATSSSSARTPTPTTSPASTPPRASSRASAARPATPRWSPAAWASRASPPPPS